jgi:hypothetical protein
MVEEKYKHIYSLYANKTLDWLPSDTRDRFFEHHKTRCHDLKKYDWVDRSFTYKFNSHGFRCEEFSDDPTLMVLGCSNTVGIGLPVESIWPELVSKKLDLKCANLGIGGGSLDTTFRLCHGYIDIVKPKIVILLTPPSPRSELFVNNTTVNNLGTWILDQNFNKIDTIKNEFFKTWINSEYNSYFNEQKNILAINQMCTERNIKFINMHADDLVFPNHGFARDLLHKGEQNHYFFAKKLLMKI